MIDIFKFTNYREYLKTCYEFLKENNSAFSYRYFSMKCGYKSPNFLKLVIDGKRNISSQSIEKFTGFLKLNKTEAKYFSLLVEFNQAKSSAQKSQFAQEILKHSTFKRLYPLGQDYFEYYSKWYYVAVREILATKQKLDPKTISDQLTPKVSEAEVESAIETLLRLGLIKKQDNRYVQAHQLVTTGDEVSSCAIAQYHKNMLDLAAKSIDHIPRELRDISSVTVSLGGENIPRLKELIQKFRQDVLELSAQDQKKLNVYQLGIQMFPLSQSKDES